ncbi:MAG: hypothetical protein KTR25_08090 [Myxococcales bacterium]|nr:hypothetical protein [Myxococcales bacterium]
MKRPDHLEVSSVTYRRVRSPRRRSVSRKPWLDSYTQGLINRLLIHRVYHTLIIRNQHLQ